MNKETQEDLKDVLEIARQKREQKVSPEDMSSWEFGKGIRKGKDSKPNVRSKIQQEGGKGL